jgi:hypothetical protein
MDSRWMDSPYGMGQVHDIPWIPDGMVHGIHMESMELTHSIWNPWKMDHSTWNPWAIRVVYPHPQIPGGLHLDSMTPPGLQVDSKWKRPQSTILYKIHLDSIWNPSGLQVEF